MASLLIFSKIFCRLFAIIKGRKQIVESGLTQKVVKIEIKKISENQRYFNVLNISVYY